jgi:hypothetical protein
MVTLPQIDPGKRALIAGRTGSGKTTLAAWFLARSKQHWIILNPKHTALYREMPYSIVHRSFDPKLILRDSRRFKFVILELSGDEADSNYMDGIIGWLHGALHNIALCADELYTLHSGGGRAGSGLTGWLTRGREFKQSFIGLTQRPAWISRFLFTESDLICEMDLTLEEDRDTMYKATGDRHFLDRVTDHRWLCYDVQRASIALYKPVPPVQLKEKSYG